MDVLLISIWYLAFQFSLYLFISLLPFMFYVCVYSSLISFATGSVSAHCVGTG